MSIAGEVTVQQVPLAAIKQDKRFWPRRELDRDRVKEFRDLYRDEPDRLPPIQVIPTPDGTSWFLVDGWHRAEALRRLHAEEVRAHVLPAETDGYLAAVEASATSSKPLTSREKRHAATRLLKEHPEWSDTKIARLVGCSSQSVANYRNPLVRGLKSAQDAVGAFFVPSRTAGRSSFSHLAPIGGDTDTDEAAATGTASPSARTPEHHAEDDLCALMYHWSQRHTATDRLDIEQFKAHASAYPIIRSVAARWASDLLRLAESE